MDPVALVRASSLVPFINFLERIGAPVERRLAAYMIPPEALHEPEGLVPLNQAFLFLEQNAKAEGVENLGILAAGLIHIEHLGAFGRIIRRAQTLHDALLKAAKLLPSYNSAHRIWLEPWRGQVRVCHGYAGNTGAGRKYGDQFTLSLLIDLVRVAAGPRWLPKEIHVERGIGDTKVDGLFGTRGSAQDVSAIVFDRALLCLPFGHRTVNGSLDHDQDLLRETAPASDFAASVRQVVQLFVRDNRVDIDRIAGVVGLSARTLQRRLAESGTDFSDMVAGVRFDLAAKLLADHAIAVTDIAQELGYSDAANFTRAFRRWAGTSPSDFRRARQSLTSWDRPNDPGSQIGMDMNVQRPEIP